MALTRRGGNRFQANIWPGFVDAMTALLLVLMFVLTIFMIVQEMLRETITGQKSELSQLNAELSALADALGMEKRRSAGLEEEIATLGSALGTVRAEAQALQARLSEEEVARRAEAAAAQDLRGRLAGAEDDLTALSLALEEERRRAEETLTLLAAAEAARDEASARADATLTEADRRAVLLAQANAALAEKEAASAESQRKMTLLNRQLAALRTELGGLQALLDEAEAKDAAAKVQIESLGTRLNAALARAASEQRARAELEEAERKRLEAEAKRLAEEAKNLAAYRSEFFGEVRRVLAGREGVRIVGDRFVFSSEVLFEPARAALSADGQAQIAGVVAILREVADDIPPEIDWILRVDGHTDVVPLAAGSEFADNWDLSQARALSVVRFMVDDLGFPPERLAAAGFGEFQPVARGDTPEARAQNRRIELKLTER